VPAHRRCNQMVRTYISLHSRLAPAGGAQVVTVSLTAHPHTWDKDAALQQLAACTRGGKRAVSTSARAAAAAAGSSTLPGWVGDDIRELRQQLLLAAMEGRVAYGPWEASLVNKAGSRPGGKRWLLQAFPPDAQRVLRCFQLHGYQLVLQEQVGRKGRGIWQCAQRRMILVCVAAHHGPPRRCFYIVPMLTGAY
jgi:hypothetical protein